MSPTLAATARRQGSQLVAKNSANPALSRLTTYNPPATENAYSELHDSRRNESRDGPELAVVRADTPPRPLPQRTSRPQSPRPGRDPRAQEPLRHDRQSTAGKPSSTP